VNADDPLDLLAGREIIVEFAVLGDVLRASAVDAATGLEAAATGPARGAKAMVERIALRKLARKIRDHEEAAAPGGRGGRLA
jgi:hypothetical protein